MRYFIRLFLLCMAFLKIKLPRQTSENAPLFLQSSGALSEFNKGNLFFAIAISSLLLSILLIGQPAWATLDASDFPQLTGHVVDNADVLNEQDEQAIANFLTTHEQATSDQIVVTTIDSLNGENLEEYANALFRHWGLGQKDKDNGVLLLFAMQDHKMRIEVGYGLEGELTDAKSKLIIDNLLTPAFKAENYGLGIKQATQEIGQILGSEQQYALFSQVPDDLPLPDYQGYFDDNLKLLDSSEGEQINAFLHNLAQASQHKIVIISQDSIGNVNPTAYTSALFKHWQLQDSDMLIVITKLKEAEIAKIDKELKHSITIKVGKDLQTLIPSERRYELITKLQSASRTDNFSFDIKDTLQETADQLDNEQDYAPLLEPTNILPAVIVSVILVVLFAWIVYRYPTNNRVFSGYVPLIASLILLTGYAYLYMQSKPQYINGGLLLNIVAFFALASLLIGIPFNIIRVHVKNLFSRQSALNNSTDPDDDDYSSSSGSSYSGGGGSSGGGGASGSW